MIKIIWTLEPKDTNYPAALSYLSLIHSPVTAEGYVEMLKKAEIVKYKAKDIFRASGLPLLDEENYHVQKNLAKIEAGHAISPILLVRNLIQRSLIIADGYHRMCAIYFHNEDTDIHSKIV